MTHAVTFSMLLVIGSACSSRTQAPPQSEQRVDEQIEKARDILVRLNKYTEPSDDIVERYERESVLRAYSGYEPHGSNARSFLNEMPEEAELKALGAAAVGPIHEFLGSTTSIKLKQRLFPVLGMIGDRSSLSVLLRACEEESDLTVRRAAIRGIGLLGNEKAIDPIVKLIGEGHVSLSDGLWILARCGKAHSADIFCDWLSNSIRADLLHSVMKPLRIHQPVEKPRKVSPRQVKGALTQDSDIDRLKDLANLADLEVPRVVALLIECLRHKDHRFQHLAATLLRKTTKSRIEEVSLLDCGSLQTGRSYQDLKKWWNEKGPQVKWSKESRAFIF